jgi:hypothetical protein
VCPRGKFVAVEAAAVAAVRPVVGNGAAGGLVICIACQKNIGVCNLDKIQKIVKKRKGKTIGI